MRWEWGGRGRGQYLVVVIYLVIIHTSSCACSVSSRDGRGPFFYHVVSCGGEVGWCGLGLSISCGICINILCDNLCPFIVSASRSPPGLCSDNVFVVVCFEWSISLNIVL